MVKQQARNKGEKSCDIPAIPKAIKINGLSEKTIILVGIYNQQFQGTIILMVFDLQVYFIIQDPMES